MNLKKCLLFSIVFLISICSINASSITLTYSDTLENIKTCTDTLNENHKYIKKGVLPFIYSAETNTTSNDFLGNCGLLSEYEFILTKDYIYNGLNFWLVKNEDKNIAVDAVYKYTNDYINDKLTDSDTSGVRPTVFAKEDAMVKGSGSILEPWEFVDVYDVEIETNNSEYGELKTNDSSEVQSKIYQKVYGDGVASAIVVPSEGYKFTLTDNKDDCANKVKTTFTDDTLSLWNITEDLKCKVYFGTETYKLTIDPNGGTYNGSSEKAVIDGEINKTVGLSEPTYSNGYAVTFDSNGGNSIGTKYAKKKFISWTLEGIGEVSDTSFTFEAGNATLTANYEDAAIELPEPYRDNYIFTGWYTSASGGTLVESPYLPTSNVTLYAHWVANSNNLVIKPNGGTYNGTKETTILTGQVNSTKTIDDPTPPSGYTITFDSNGGTTASSIKSTSSFSKWSLEGDGSFLNKTFTFGSNNSTLTATYINDSIILPKTTKTGYSFAGWYTASSGGTKVGGGGSSYTPTSNITLYAKWNINSYTLTINPNGGKWNSTTNNSSVTGNYNSTKKISNPTPPSYTIKFNSNGGTSASSKTSTKSFQSWTLTGSGSLTSGTYKFGADNGTLKANYKDSSITLPTITKTGYSFAGWYTASSGGTKVGGGGSSYTPTKNITLYAHWKTFDEVYDCKFTTTTGSIFAWNSKSSCNNASKSGCNINGCNTLGVIKKGEDICVKEVKTNKTDYKSVYAWVKWSSLSDKGAAIASKTVCKETYGVDNVISVVFGGKTYYKATVTVYCTNSSCRYGWVVGTNGQSFFK